MKLSLKASFVRSLALGSLAAVVAFAHPAKANAQGFGVAVQFGNASPAAYGPGYDNRVLPGYVRGEDWRRHEEWVRHEEWLRHREWERSRGLYSRPFYTPTPFGFHGR